MRNYTFGAGLPYKEWLKHKALGDISNDLYEIKYEVPRQARKIVASQSALANRNSKLAQSTSRAITDASREIQQVFAAGVDELSYRLDDISDGIIDLNNSTAIRRNLYVVACPQLIAPMFKLVLHPNKQHHEKKTIFSRTNCYVSSQS